VKEKKLPFLSLVDEKDRKKIRMPGWCTYTTSFDASPEMEVICGGSNSKSPTAGAVWRQGNLLHFGFEPDPSQLNATGRALLVNAIVYASRFAGDRPLFKTVSPFKKGGSGRTRVPITPVFVARWRERFQLGYLAHWFVPALIETMPKDSAEAFWTWFDEKRAYLRPTASGKLDFDRDAVALGAAPAADGFFEKALAALAQGGETAERARRLLVRYAPDGAPPGGTSADWHTWWKENGPYLFFCSPEGFRWHLDAFARNRGLPSRECRGPARAAPLRFRPPRREGHANRPSDADKRPEKE